MDQDNKQNGMYNKPFIGMWGNLVNRIHFTYSIVTDRKLKLTFFTYCDISSRKLMS